MGGRATRWLSVLVTHLLAGARRFGNGLAAASKRIGQWLAKLGSPLRQVVEALPKALKFVWRRLELLLLGVLFIVPLLASLVVAYGGADELGVPPVRVKQALSLSMSLVAIGLLWLVAWIACRLFVRLVRTASFGDRLGPRVISFLVIWAFFPKLPKVAVVTVFWCAFQVVCAVPGNLLRMAGSPEVPSQTADRPTSSAAQSPMADGNARGSPPALSEVETDHPTPAPAQGSKWHTERESMRESTRLVLDVGARLLTAVDGELQRVWVEVRKGVALADLAVAIIAWIALVFLLSRMFQSISRLEPQARSSRVSGAIARGAKATLSVLSDRWPVLSHNLAFLLILALGAFLSLAAILSLPRLRESNKPNSEVSVDALRAELQQLHITKDQLIVYLPEDLLKRDTQATLSAGDKNPGAVAAAANGGQDSSKLATSSPESSQDRTAATAASEARAKQIYDLVSTKRAEYEKAHKELDEFLDTPDIDQLGPASTDADRQKYTTALNERSKAARKLRVQMDTTRTELEEAESRASLQFNFQDYVEQSHRLLSTFALRGSQLRDVLIQDGEQALADAVSAYRQENIDRQGSREQTQHFQLVRDWFAQRVADHRVAARQCGEALARFRSELAEWESKSRELLDRIRSGLPASSMSSSPPEFLLRTCDLVDHGTSRPPHSPELGDSLGAFKPVAAWLLNADSLALALVAGLLGFGLLGSVISTFVKAQIEQQKAGAVRSGVIGTDLTGVVLRGISAAVVLFLAVQGGLAVLSGPGAAPNPYVLLLACFVAAVFSERIWRKTLDYLTERLGEIKNTEVSSKLPSGGAPSGSEPSDPGAEGKKHEDEKDSGGGIEPPP